MGSETSAPFPRPLLRTILRFVRRNLDAKLTWVDMAAHVGIERHAFGRRFKRTTGLTPRQYVIRKRLRRAKALLAGRDASVAQVALDVGCSCQSHLTTLFRQHLDTTPAAYRRRAAARRHLFAAVR